MHIIILAGGGGTRLWPLSRQSFPKQFLHFGDGESLLQKSVSRFLHSSFAQTISIATNAQYESLVKKQLDKIADKKQVHVIVEPERKNTAPALAFAIRFLQERCFAREDDAVLVLPSDHLIDPQEVFLDNVEEITPLVQQYIVLFGIVPKRAETGYGYVEAGPPFESGVYRVKRFVEKPNASRAQRYISSGKYYWNAGIFAFSIGLFWSQVRSYAPLIYAIAKQELTACYEAFGEMPEISFDYAVLEKSKDIVIRPLAVHWSDVGCWDSVYDILHKDENHNAKVGNVVEIETKNSLILGGKRLISTIGLEDLLIVETEDVTFISKRGSSQRVKEIVQSLVQNKKAALFEQFSWGTICCLDQSKEGFLYKVQIEPAHSYTSNGTHKKKWTPLSGSIQYHVGNETFKEAKAFHWVTVAEGVSFTVTNMSSLPLALLLFSSFEERVAIF